MSLPQQSSTETPQTSSNGRQGFFGQQSHPAPLQQDTVPPKNRGFFSQPAQSIPTQPRGSFFNSNPASNPPHSNTVDAGQAIPPRVGGGGFFGGAANKNTTATKQSDTKQSDTQNGQPQQAVTPVSPHPPTQEVNSIKPPPPPPPPALAPSSSDEKLTALGPSTSTQGTGNPPVADRHVNLVFGPHLPYYSQDYLLYCSPSRRDGVSSMEETILLYQGLQALFLVSTRFYKGACLPDQRRVEIPPDLYTFAFSLYHATFARQSVTKYSTQEIALTCLYIASKLVGGVFCRYYEIIGSYLLTMSQFKRISPDYQSSTSNSQTTSEALEDTPSSLLSLSTKFKTLPALQQFAILTETVTIRDVQAVIPLLRKHNQVDPSVSAARLGPNATYRPTSALYNAISPSDRNYNSLFYYLCRRLIYLEAVVLDSVSYQLNIGNPLSDLPLVLALILQAAKLTVLEPTPQGHSTQHKPNRISFPTKSKPIIDNLLLIIEHTVHVIDTMYKFTRFCLQHDPHQLLIASIIVALTHIKHTFHTLYHASYDYDMFLTIYNSPWFTVHAFDSAVVNTLTATYTQVQSQEGDLTQSATLTPDAHSDSPASNSNPASIRYSHFRPSVKSSRFLKTTLEQLMGHIHGFQSATGDSLPTTPLPCPRCMHHPQVQPVAPPPPPPAFDEASQPSSIQAPAEQMPTTHPVPPQQTVTDAHPVHSGAVESITEVPDSPREDDDLFL